MTNLARQQHLAFKAPPEFGLLSDVRSQRLQRAVLALQMLIGDFVDYAHAPLSEKSKNNKAAAQDIAAMQEMLATFSFWQGRLAGEWSVNGILTHKVL
jgi:hypothetical protein